MKKVLGLLFALTLTFAVSVDDVSANENKNGSEGENALLEVGSYNVSEFPPSFSNEEVTPFMGGGSIQLLSSTFNFNDRMTSSSFRLASGTKGTAQVSSINATNRYYLEFQEYVNGTWRPVSGSASFYSKGNVTKYVSFSRVTWDRSLRLQFKRDGSSGSSGTIRVYDYR